MKKNARIRRRSITGTGTTALVALALIAGVARADVKVRLAITGGMLRVGQALPVRVTVVNPNPAPAQILKPDLQGTGPSGLEFQISVPGEDGFRPILAPVYQLGPFKLKTPPEPWELPVLAIPADGSIDIDLALSCDFTTPHGSPTLFPVPGTYRLQAVVVEIEGAADPERAEGVPVVHLTRLQSEIQTVRVWPPANAAEQRAFQTLNSTADTYLVYAPEAYMPETHGAAREGIRTFLRDCGDSAWADYAGMAAAYMTVIDARRGRDPIADSAGLETLRALQDKKSFAMHGKAAELLQRLQAPPEGDADETDPAPAARDADAGAGASVPAEVDTAVRELVSGFAAAFRRGDVAVCLDLLAPDFVYQDALDRNGFGEQLADDGSRLRDLPEAVFELYVERVVPSEAGVVAELVRTWSQSRDLPGVSAQEVWQLAPDAAGAWRVHVIRCGVESEPDLELPR